MTLQFGPNFCDKLLDYVAPLDERVGRGAVQAARLPHQWKCRNERFASEGRFSFHCPLRDLPRPPSVRPGGRGRADGRTDGRERGTEGRKEGESH